MSINALMRLAATVCFAVVFVGAIAGSGVGGPVLIALGLALWCGSTLVP